MRKWTERIKPWPAFKADLFYQVEVMNIEKTRKQIEVTVKVLDTKICERIICFSLSVPIRPDGLTADFFRACHMPIKAGAQICPKETLNKKLYLQCIESPNSLTIQSFRAEKQPPFSGKED